jgi:hypothetical protein
MAPQKHNQYLERWKICRDNSFLKYTSQSLNCKPEAGVSFAPNQLITHVQNDNRKSVPMAGGGGANSFQVIPCL